MVVRTVSATKNAARWWYFAPPPRRDEQQHRWRGGCHVKVVVNKEAIRCRSLLSLCGLKLIIFMPLLSENLRQSFSLRKSRYFLPFVVNKKREREREKLFFLTNNKHFAQKNKKKKKKKKKNDFARCSLVVSVLLVVAPRTRVEEDEDEERERRERERDLKSERV